MIKDDYAKVKKALIIQPGLHPASATPTSAPMCEKVSADVSPPHVFFNPPTMLEPIPTTAPPATPFLNQCYAVLRPELPAEFTYITKLDMLKRGFCLTYTQE